MVCPRDLGWDHVAFGVKGNIQVVIASIFLFCNFLSSGARQLKLYWARLGVTNQILDFFKKKKRKKKRDLPSIRERNCQLLNTKCWFSIIPMTLTQGNSDRQTSLQGCFRFPHSVLMYNGNMWKQLSRLQSQDGALWVSSVVFPTASSPCLPCAYVTQSALLLGT